MKGTQPRDWFLAEGLALLEASHWFEAHEVLESAWRMTAYGAERTLLQALIQLAVSMEHARRGNLIGERGQWEKASAKLATLPDTCLGIDVRRTRQAWEAFRAAHPPGTPSAEPAAPRPRVLMALGDGDKTNKPPRRTSGA